MRQAAKVPFRLLTSKASRRAPRSCFGRKFRFGLETDIEIVPEAEVYIFYVMLQILNSIRVLASTDGLSFTKGIIDETII